jgi:hypothetical protein
VITQVVTPETLRRAAHTWRCLASAETIPWAKADALATAERIERQAADLEAEQAVRVQS